MIQRFLVAFLLLCSVAVAGEVIHPEDNILQVEVLKEGKVLSNSSGFIYVLKGTTKNEAGEETKYEEIYLISGNTSIDGDQLRVGNENVEIKVEPIKAACNTQFRVCVIQLAKMPKGIKALELSTGPGEKPDCRVIGFNSDGEVMNRRVKITNKFEAVFGHPMMGMTVKVFTYDPKNKEDNMNPMFGSMVVNNGKLVGMYAHFDGLSYYGVFHSGIKTMLSTFRLVDMGEHNPDFVPREEKEELLPEEELELQEMP